jgi:hypothetical protein
LKIQFSQFLMPTLTNPTAPYILYFDAASNTMQLGAWGNQITAANYQSKMLWFKFGGVVGFDLNDTAFSTDVIRFNPMSTPASITNWASVPFYTTEDWDADRKDVSASTYHHKTNVLAGKGDPCKLVGLTIKQIQAGTVDNGRFRLPTLKENQDFVGSPDNQTTGSAYYSWTTGSPGVGTMYLGTAKGFQLPTPGHYLNDGTVDFKGSHGIYWSSTASSTVLRGYCLFVNSNYISSSYWELVGRGFSVRCVPQS